MSKNNDLKETSNTWPCTFFFGLRGGPSGCTSGDKCKFSHDEKSLKFFEKSKCSPCVFHFGLNGKKPGTCTKGEKCSFSHEPLAVEKKIKYTSNNEEVKAAGICLWKIVDGVKLFFLIDHTMKETGEIVKAEPGGKIEPDDSSIFSTALREFKEEVGYSFPFTETNMGDKYIPVGKYLMYIHRVSDSFEFPPNAKGNFIDIANCKLHPRSVKFFSEFDKIIS